MSPTLTCPSSECGGSILHRARSQSYRPSTCIRASFFRACWASACGRSVHIATQKEPIARARTSSVATCGQWGGIVGAAEAFGGAVENQRLGTPHLHFHVGVASAFQHKTLHEIAQMVEEDLVDLGDVYDYASWVCCEDHLVPEQHEAELPQNEREFPEYSAAENDALCKLPLYIAKDDCGTMWDAANPMSEKAAREEGNTYRHTYLADVQFLFFAAAAPLAYTREGEGRDEGRRMEAPHVL